MGSASCNLVDEIERIIATKLLLHKDAKPAVSADMNVELKNAIKLIYKECIELADDVLIRGLINQS